MTQELYERRRAAWLKLIGDWTRRIELARELRASFEPRLKELFTAWGNTYLKELGLFSDTIIQGHHQTGTPLALPFIYAAAFTERPREFTNGTAPEVFVLPRPCFVCAYPMLVRHVKLSYPVPPRGPQDWLNQPLLTNCAMCGAEADNNRAYRLEHDLFPNGLSEPLPPLELEPTSELLRGTHPADYGITKVYTPPKTGFREP